MYKNNPQIQKKEIVKKERGIWILLNELNSNDKYIKKMNESIYKKIFK